MFANFVKRINKDNMRSIVIFDTYLDTRRPNKNGLYPVKLRVTFQRKTQYYKTNVFLDEYDYEKVIGKNPKGKYQDIRFTLDAILEKAKSVQKELGAFSLSEFENRFYKSTPGKQDIYSVYNEIIEDFNTKNSFGTAEIYQNSLRWIKEFYGKGKSILPFESIKEQDLERFVNHYKGLGRSITTISMYLRCLHRVYNLAIQKEVCLPENNPFKSKFKIPKVRNIKKAITGTEIQKIIDYEAPPGSQLEKAKDFWLLSFFCFGINFGDMLRIKNGDIKKDTLTFIRRKTEKAGSNTVKPIIVSLTPKSHEIIKKYRQSGGTKDDYLFGYLQGNYTEKQIRTRIKSFIRMVNRHIKMIAEELGIDPGISTYTCRHSAATLAYNKAVPMSFISESLGHSNLLTTTLYTKSLPVEEISRLTGQVFEDFHK